jgi:DnaJ-class molecular chaperone
MDGKKKKIKIPAGIDDGSQIQFNDFNVVVSVKPDKTFLRQGADIIVDVDVPLFLAVAGGELEVPTPDGKTKIHLKPGTQAESALRLSELGMPSVRGGGRGNLYARLHVKIPKWTELNPKQKKAIEELS